MKRQVNDMGVSKDEMLKILRDKNNRLQKECDQWKREALTYADQLGMLRIWFDVVFAESGENMDTVLEEMKDYISINH
jgi:hypothetical protein